MNRFAWSLFAPAVTTLSIAALSGLAIAETAPMRAGGPAQGAAPATGGISGKAAAVTSRGKVLETMDAGSYTYARVETSAGSVWLAGPHTPLKVDDVVGWPAGTEMKGFVSKTLGRTFDSILFVDRLAVAGPSASAPPHGTMSGKTTEESGAPAITGIAKADGGVTIAELYDGRSTFEGKDVTVRGKVVKSNQGVMKRNWLHLRDGSRSKAGENDLTVTSDGTANVGDTVVVRGKVVLNKDFGFNYRYDVMLEGAKISVE